MFDYIQVGVIRVEVNLLFVLAVVALVRVRNRDEPEVKDGYAGPDYLNVPWERCRELVLRALDNKQALNSDSVESKPRKRTSTVATGIRHVFVPFLGRSEGKKSPDEDTEFE